MTAFQPCRSSRCRHRGACARNPAAGVPPAAPAPDADSRPRCFEPEEPPAEVA